MPPNETIRLSSIPARLNPASKQSAAEPSPLSASSFGSGVEDYIGSGSDTVGQRTPGIDQRLSFQDDGHALPKADDFDLSDDDLDNMSDGSSRPAYLRTHDGRSGAPLLPKTDDDSDRTRYGRSPSPLARGPGMSNGGASGMRSRSPGTQARVAVRKKYTIAGIFLVISLVSFVIQTEAGRYVQHTLGWNKAYCMLYFTHGSWALLWPAQLLILRVQQRHTPWPVFWRRHLALLRSTAQMVAHQSLDVVPQRGRARLGSPLGYILRTTALTTSTLTIAGLSWYVAVNMTSPSDLTAIYNCSAFFAYAFSVPLLKEKLRLDKSVAVLIAIAGVLVVAYGDSKPADDTAGAGAESPAASEAGSRFLGNMIIGAGSVLYGLYEVIYKRWACPPEGTSATRGMLFANAFGSCIGLFTLLVLWVPLPVLHLLGWETFELPTGRAALYLWISVLMNATFAGSFLVLISLTSPVLSSVAALLTIFIVAVADWLLTGERISPAAVAGGVAIIVAFLMLSWSTWREMTEDAGAGEAGDGGGLAAARGGGGGSRSRSSKGRLDHRSSRYGGGGHDEDGDDERDDDLPAADYGYSSDEDLDHDNHHRRP